MINWNNIRPINHSQNEGFEELVCQLARQERGIEGRRFIRKGKPDAGVECFWILKNGTEHAWQAKFFTTSLSNNQWTEVDASVQTALNKHPNLTKYYIAIPVDTPDARVPRQKSMLEKWDEHVIKWTGWAAAKGMTVQFIYWGQSDLIDRLSWSENTGKTRFWFNTNEFTDEWLKEKINFAINALGERYTPELNFKLPIAAVFNGISRNSSFKKLFDKYYEDIYKKRRQCYQSFSCEELKGIIQQADNLFEDLNKTYSDIDVAGITPIDFDSLKSICKSIYEILEKSTEKLYKERAKKEAANPTPKHGSKPFSDVLNELYELKNTVRAIESFMESTTCMLTNNPYLVLRGNAGFGKSHLLGDIIANRLKNNQLSIFLLGQFFVTEENPWSQILKHQFLLDGDEHSFLGALNSKAEASGTRILIVIDALNEGKGKHIWYNHIVPFMKVVKKYPWLGAIVSVRTSYEKIVIPKSIYENEFAYQLTHYGFAEHEYEAADFFFDNYGIKKPGVPLLHPEFRSPLFLRLFCEGLKRKNMHEIPAGYEGISTIIDFFLSGINEKLALKHQYSSQINIVRKSIEALANKIASESMEYIGLAEGNYFFNDLPELRIIQDRAVFFNDLIDEGVLSKNLYWNKDKSNEEGVYFSYERFFDHIVASFLIKNIGKKPLKAFKQGGQLFSYFRDERTCHKNKGLVEAFSIQIPEKYDLEFFEMIPHVKETLPVSEAFVDSIIWRKKETFWSSDQHSNSLRDKVGSWFNKVALKNPEVSKEKRLKNYLNEIVCDKNGLFDYFLENILLITSTPNHIFNADFLHNHLIKDSLADRDAWWLPFIHNLYYDGTSVKRLVDWGWRDENRRHLTDESVLLAATTLSWFLTSSNRYLRDSATKALISLLQFRLQLIIPLLSKFEGINDPYVYERLFAVAYGCSVRTDNKEALTDLSNYIFEAIFNKELVYPNILLRDYARGVIEYTLTLNCKFDIDLAKIRPPYRSILPTIAPTNEEIDARYYLDYNAPGHKPYHWSQNNILSSMTTEYGRGTSGYGDFGRYTFERALGYWDVNPDALSNIAIEKIFQMGYDVERHGKFDSSEASGSGAPHNERIGKKYQWIVFYELLAQVADNCTLYESRHSKDNSVPYEGPWDPYIRDIDPTLLIKQTKEKGFDEEDENEAGNSQWPDTAYNNWNISHKDWVMQTNDMPSINGLINIKDAEGIEWLVLEMHPEWGEPKPLGQDRWDIPHKRLWLQIRSYLVKEEEFEKFKEWGEKTAFWGRWMPEAKSRYQVFSREYYWSQAYKYFQEPYYGGGETHDVHDEKTREYIGEVMLSTENFNWEEEFDCSKTESISFLKPGFALWKGMGLKYSHDEGAFINSNNEVVCYDPCVNSSELSCLLVRKKDFIEFLTKEKLRIFWTVIGEKQIIGGFGNRKNIPAVQHEINGFCFMKNGIIVDNIRSLITDYTKK